MKEASVIFRKVFVQQYYRLNAGFFLVVVTLCFGFMSGREHKALAQFFISSPLLVLIPVVTWSFYLMKVINFNASRLRHAENAVVYHISFFPRKSQLLVLFSALMTQMLPALAYGLFLVFQTIQNSRPVEGTIVVGSLAGIMSVGTLVWLKAFDSQQREIKIWTIKSYFDKRFVKPLFFIYVTWLLRQEPMLVVATKIFSGAVLFGVTQLYTTDVYDWRLLSMGIILAGAANFMVLKQLHTFDNVHFRIFKNLPTGIFRWSLTFLCVCFIVVIPELSVILKNFPTVLEAMDLIFVALLLMASLFYFYALNYLAISEDKMSRWVLGSFLAGILLSLFKIPMPALAAITFVISMVVIQNRRYLYEGSIVPD